MSEQKLSKKLHDDMVKLLKAEMPEHVCGFVKDRLAEADQMEKRIEEQDVTIAENAKELCALRDLKLKADKLEKLADDLSAQESQLTHERGLFERDRKVFELEQKLSAQTTVANNTMEVMRSLTRNVDFRRNVFKNEDIVNPGYTDQYGCNIGPSNTGYRANSDETITESAE